MSDGAGFDPTPIKPLQRVIDTEEEPQTMRAKSLSFPHGMNPEALLQIAQHETPEFVLQPGYMDHPHSAKSIIEVIVCTNDPETLATRYAMYAGNASKLLEGVYTIELEFSRISICSSASLKGYSRIFKLLITRTNSSDKSLAFLNHSGVDSACSQMQRASSGLCLAEIHRA